MRHSYPHRHVQVCEARLRAAKVTVSPSNIGRPHVDRLWLLDTGRYNHGTVRQVLAGQLEATTGRSGSVHQIDFKCCKIKTNKHFAVYFIGTWSTINYRAIQKRKVVKSLNRDWTYLHKT